MLFVNNGSIYQPHIVQGQTKTWIKNVFSKDKTVKTIKEDLINAIADEKKEQDMPSIMIMCSCWKNRNGRNQTKPK